MSKGLTWRISLIFIFLVCSLVFLAPTFISNLPSWWGGPFLPKDKISLGLDLQGGIHLVMEVETQKAVEGQLDIIATDVEDTLNSKTLRFKKVSRLGSDRIAIVLYDKGTASTVEALLKEKYPRLRLLAPFDEGGFINLQMEMSATGLTSSA
jgi:preprotein translocase subunit SecD